MCANMFVFFVKKTYVFCKLTRSGKTSDLAWSTFRPLDTINCVVHRLRYSTKYTINAKADGSS